MPDLRSYLNLVEAKAPDLVQRVAAEVDPRWELSSVQMRLQQTGRLPILVFERVAGHSMPVVTNLFAGRRHMALAMGTTPDRVVEDFADAASRKLATHSVTKGPVKDVVRRGDDADLRGLPLVTHCEKDAGPYLSSGVTIMRHPATGELNAGIYRNLYLSPRSLTMNMAPLSHGAEIAREAETLHKPVDAAIIVGHHPAMSLASQHRGARSEFELEIMGALLGEPVETTPAETIDVPVPAHAEIVIEGRIRTDAWADVGFLVSM